MQTFARRLQYRGIYRLRARQERGVARNYPRAPIHFDIRVQSRERVTRARLFARVRRAEIEPPFTSTRNSRPDERFSRRCAAGTYSEITTYTRGILFRRNTFNCGDRSNGGFPKLYSYRYLSALTSRVKSSSACHRVNNK